MQHNAPLDLVSAFASQYPAPSDGQAGRMVKDCRQSKTDGLHSPRITPTSLPRLLQRSPVIWAMPWADDKCHLVADGDRFLH
jgi:hypothetical protein